MGTYNHINKLGTIFYVYHPLHRRYYNIITRNNIFIIEAHPRGGVNVFPLAGDKQIRGVLAELNAGRNTEI